jgi:hypothetical protein
MSRFFFHICEGSKELYIDHVGEELPDCASAWRIASEYAGESIRDLDGGLKLNVEWRLDVNDDQNRPLYRISVVARRM